jgi:hypothetical protein
MTRDEIKEYLGQHFPGFYLITSGNNRIEIAMPWTPTSITYLTIYIDSLDRQTPALLDSYMQKAAQICTKKVP